MEFSRSMRARAPSPSKLNSVRQLHRKWHSSSRSTFVPGEPVCRTAEAINRTGACRSTRAPASLERR